MGPGPAGRHGGVGEGDGVTGVTDWWARAQRAEEQKVGINLPERGVDPGISRMRAHGRSHWATAALVTDLGARGVLKWILTVHGY